MPKIQAFRGLRYDLGHVGALSDVVAPPYDVIDDKLQEVLYKQHPANVIRLILNRIEPGDDEVNSRYTRAARFLKNWIAEGVLQVEGDPAVYVYHQQFDYEGLRFVRRGFMSRVELEPFGTGRIYPHEETHSAARQDRLMLTRACKANLSQIFGLYPDAENAAQRILDPAIEGSIPLEATDHLGVVHRLWPVTDVSVITQLTQLLDPKPMFIADGHHRYETALNYLSEVNRDDNLPGGHPARYVLTMCVSMHDQGMIVLPTHRLFRGLPSISSDELKTKLTPYFECRIAGEGIDLAESHWETIEAEGDQGSLALFTAADSRWVFAKLNGVGRSKMSELAADRSDAWRELAVSILQKLILEHVLGATDLPKPSYVHLVSEMIEQVEDDGDAFPLAALVMPATLDHVKAISEAGERMPAKSTYFYPKLLSGLVINPLE